MKSLVSPGPLGGRDALYVLTCPFSARDVLALPGESGEHPRCGGFQAALAGQGGTEMGPPLVRRPLCVWTGWDDQQTPTQS